MVENQVSGDKQVFEALLNWNQELNLGMRYSEIEYFLANSGIESAFGTNRNNTQVAACKGLFQCSTQHTDLTNPQSLLSQLKSDVENNTNNINIIPAEQKKAIFAALEKSRAENGNDFLEKDDKANFLVAYVLGKKDASQAIAAGAKEELVNSAYGRYSLHLLGGGNGSRILTAPDGATMASLGFKEGEGTAIGNNPWAFPKGANTTVAEFREKLTNKLVDKVVPIVVGSKLFESGNGVADVLKDLESDSSTKAKAEEIKKSLGEPVTPEKIKEAYVPVKLAINEIFKTQGIAESRENDALALRFGPYAAAKILKAEDGKLVKDLSSGGLTENSINKYLQQMKETGIAIPEGKDANNLTAKELKEFNNQYVSKFSEPIIAQLRQSTLTTPANDPAAPAPNTKEAESMWDKIEKWMPLLQGILGTEMGVILLIVGAFLLGSMGGMGSGKGEGADAPTQVTGTQAPTSGPTRGDQYAALMQASGQKVTLEQVSALEKAMHSVLPADQAQLPQAQRQIGSIVMTALHSDPNITPKQRAAADEKYKAILDTAAQKGHITPQMRDMLAGLDAAGREKLFDAELISQEARRGRITYQIAGQEEQVITVANINFGDDPAKSPDAVKFRNLMAAALNAKSGDEVVIKVAPEAPPAAPARQMAATTQQQTTVQR